MNQLLNRFYFVIAMLLVYRFGTYVPLPGVDPSLLTDVVKQNEGSVLGMLNMLTGGALGRLSIFALNIMPYITASIVMQLLSVLIKDIAVLKKEGGKQKLNQYVRYLTIVLALFQGYGIAVGAESFVVGGVPVVSSPGLVFRFVAAINLAGGTLFVMWLTEQISARGVGNGSSLVIFSGIVAGLPSAVASLFSMGKSGAVSTVFVLFVIFMTFLLLGFIVFMEKAQRKILVTYPKRQVGRKVFAEDSTHFPIKVNTSGVVGPLFASSLLLFPTTILGFMESSSGATTSWKYQLMAHLGHGKPLYILLYAILIVFFNFFYTSIVFNVEETTENLRRAKAVLKGIRPGANTADYMNYVLTRVTAIGAVYVVIICVVPEIFIAQYSIPFYLGGTSLLIVVNVVMDLFQQTQMYLLSSQYGSLIKNNILLNRR